MSDVRDPATDQPLPVPGKQLVQDLLIRAIDERQTLGIAKYGRPLETHNGRDALTDLWEELLDALSYLSQYRLERGDQLNPDPTKQAAARKGTLAHALGLPPHAPWDDIISTARQRTAIVTGTSTTDQTVREYERLLAAARAERHEATTAAKAAARHRDRQNDRLRKARAQRDTAQADAERWQSQAAALGKDFLAQRRRLASVLGLPDGERFAVLIDTADGNLRRLRETVADRRAMHDAVADRLGRSRDTSWPALMESLADHRRNAETAQAERDTARDDAEQLRESLANIAAAPVNSDVWARIGTALGWSPERSAAEARQRVSHSERDLSATIDTLRAERNTRRGDLAAALDRSGDTPWPDLLDTAAKAHAGAHERAAILEAARDALEEAGVKGPHGDDWPDIAPGIRVLAERAEDGRREFADLRNTHEERRRTLCANLDIPTSTAWDTLIDHAQQCARFLAMHRKVTADVARRLDAWDKQLPPMISTATATEAIRQIISRAPVSAIADTAPERCCVCGSNKVTYHNYREQPFCWRCADCDCGQDQCIRTGIHTPADGADKPCGRCGKPQADHIDWAQGHLHTDTAASTPAMSDGA